MFDLFKKYSDWKILSYFLQHPSQSVYVRELAKILDVSPSSVSLALNKFRRFGLVLKKEMGQTHFYKLNNDFIGIRGLKEFFFMVQLLEVEFVNSLLKLDENIITVVLYGSFAAGDYDHLSDIDILVIAPKKFKLNKLIEDFEDKLSRELNIEILSINQWTKLKERNDPFYNNVKMNYVLLYGGELI